MKSISCPLMAAFTAISVAAAEPAWSFDANLRIRAETRERNTTFNRAVPSTSDDTWFLTRARVGLKGVMSPALTLYAQLQDSREHGSERPSIPFVAGSEGDDPLDVRQAYLEWRTPETTWRVGRQLLALGDERLVGASEWTNFARAFDAARLTLPKIGTGLDLFVSSVVQTQPGSRTGWQANHSSHNDILAGAYSRFNPRPGLALEPYFFWRDSRKDVVYTAGAAGTARPFDIPQKVATLGMRLAQGIASSGKGFDYDVDAAYQNGEARGRQLVAGTFAYPGPAWIDHRAWALHGGVGYSWKVGAVPFRVYAERNQASGDSDPTDDRTESFLNLFPTNHKFYGGMDVFAWKNMREWAVIASTTLAGCKLRLEHHWFSLDNVNDTWFRANAVTMVRPLTAAARQAPRRAGAEMDFVISRPIGKRVLVEAGASYFNTGAYLRATGGSSDAKFGYLQTAFQW